MSVPNPSSERTIEPLHTVTSKFHGRSACGLGLGGSAVDEDKIVGELKRYESEFTGILSRFRGSRSTG
jgi:hypothetical protein